MLIFEHIRNKYINAEKEDCILKWYRSPVLTDRKIITNCNFSCNHFVTKKSVDKAASFMVQWHRRERKRKPTQGTPTAVTEKRIVRGEDASSRMSGAEPWLGYQKGINKDFPALIEESECKKWQIMK